MSDHYANREKVIEALREELIGPSPQGKQINCSGEITFTDVRESYGPWRQEGSGEEILQRDPPAKRYGVAVLFPAGTGYSSVSIEEFTDDAIAEANDPASPYAQIADSENISTDELDLDSWQNGVEAESDDLDLSTSNSFKPSSMAVSFLAELPDGAEVLVEAFGGRYLKKTILVANKERTWWLRSAVTMESRFSSSDILSTTSASVPASSVETSNCDGLNLGIEIYSRPHEIGNTRLLTVCLINREEAKGSLDEKCLFQSHFRVTVSSPNGIYNILPYHSITATNPDQEEESLSLLYRNYETFGVGHGCAADWVADPVLNRASLVSAETIPEFETPSITPNVRRVDGTPVEVSMAALAGLIPEDDGFVALSEVIDLYEGWVEEREQEILELSERHQTAASRHMKECRRCIERMRLGLEYLKRDEKALKAFRLANQAVLLQQICTQGESRAASYDGRQQRIVYSDAYSDPSAFKLPPGRGYWRGFQVAFLLMAAQSAADGNAPDRNTVELIWFPTGGGKTEAYFGLAAFSVFLRRLTKPDDEGVHVLMRYTLRLLTAQQFQRASGLICAMEYLRRQGPAELGTKPFSIGIWLGGATTPNRRQDAVRALTSLNNNKYAENPFILLRCPWCRAQMGPMEFSGKRPKHFPAVLGYERQGDTVVFKCSDKRNCEFKDGLPIFVIDEDIYDGRPDLVIGTVDKFAMLSWRPEARALFGINWDGDQEFSPPGLIIQDELHLISGPLGSMVGLYETLVAELCTDRRHSQPVPPKIVSSTATIRRYSDQIKAIYARDEVALFPPPGLDAADSFFARFARKEDGSLDSGRKYVGVHAPGLGSMQTVQVRSFCSLLQSPVSMSVEDQDPWWTLMVFFNSIRELGTTVSLFQSDIQDYLRVFRNRTGKQFSEMRQLRVVEELTGRLRSSEVPKAISKLETSCTSTSGKPAVDVCLASNIIEVGIDIDRLSVMAVVGQPKTTSQYIQVTGRVGRRWWERPGLVITLYGTSKPRDRSHFEKFRTYHSQLYAQVEPTSVTPFSPPVLDRALHAIISGYVRQRGDERQSNSPYPYPEGLISWIRAVIRRRVEKVDGEELDNFEKVFDRRENEWRRWQHTQWGAFGRTDPNALLRQTGAYVASDQRLLSWPTPASVRNVDAECEAEITRLYLRGDGQ